jgi:hypothetical protein
VISSLVAFAVIGSPTLLFRFLSDHSSFCSSSVLARSCGRSPTSVLARSCGRSPTSVLARLVQLMMGLLGGFDGMGPRVVDVPDSEWMFPYPRSLALMNCGGEVAFARQRAKEERKWLLVVLLRSSDMDRDMGAPIRRFRCARLMIVSLPPFVSLFAAVWTSSTRTACCATRSLTTRCRWASPETPSPSRPQPSPPRLQVGLA